MTAGEIEIDRPTRRVTVAGQRVLLPTKEYELLLKLASDPRRVFTKDELLRDVWGFRSTGRTRTLDSTLRDCAAASAATTYATCGASATAYSGTEPELASASERGNGSA